MRVLAAALAWAVAIAAATFFGGFVGPLLGLGVALALAGVIAARRRLGLFAGWTSDELSRGLGLAITLGVVLWILALWILARVSERAFFVYAGVLGAYALGYLLRAALPRRP